MSDKVIRAGKIKGSSVGFGQPRSNAINDKYVFPSVSPFDYWELRTIPFFFKESSCVLSKPKDLRIESVCSPSWGAGPLGLTSDVANLIGILTVV